LKGGFLINMKTVEDHVEGASANVCPIYNECRTGRDLNEQSCTQYRCNTFYIRFPDAERHKTYSPFSRNGNGKMPNL